MPTASVLVQICVDTVTATRLHMVVKRLLASMGQTNLAGADASAQTRLVQTFHGARLAWAASGSAAQLLVG